MTEIDIEKLELKYLNKYYYFLKFAIDEILEGLNTKDKISGDWKGLWGTKISSYSTGAERVVYSLLNGKGIGIPNSSPVGSDLFLRCRMLLSTLTLRQLVQKILVILQKAFLLAQTRTHTNTSCLLMKVKKMRERESTSHTFQQFTIKITKKKQNRASHTL